MVYLLYLILTIFQGPWVVSDLAGVKKEVHWGNHHEEEGPEIRWIEEIDTWGGYKLQSMHGR